MAEVTGDRHGERRAAGGVLWRMAEDGTLEVLLVHRPRYDDWTFPKGKRDEGDVDDLACALREVHEETGLRCVLGHELEPVRYEDRHGRPKVVRYWEMRPVAGEFRPTDEVDAICWLPVPDARRQLSYELDRAVLDSFVRFACGAAG